MELLTDRNTVQSKGLGIQQLLIFIYVDLKIFKYRFQNIVMNFLKTVGKIIEAVDGRPPHQWGYDTQGKYFCKVCQIDYNGTNLCSGQSYAIRKGLPVRQVRQEQNQQREQGRLVNLSINKDTEKQMERDIKQKESEGQRMFRQKEERLKLLKIEVQTLELQQRQRQLARRQKEEEEQELQRQRQRARRHEQEEQVPISRNEAQSHSISLHPLEDPRNRIFFNPERNQVTTRWDQVRSEP